MPILDWIGKKGIINSHKKVPFRFLEKDDSKSTTNPESLFIEGDNLDAIKSILPYYKNKIKCVYIDPPYNTGNEELPYNDNVDSPIMKKWLTKIIKADDLLRHDKWLCIMYPRLMMLKELISEDGGIFVQIGDNEEHHLRIILDEIFGEKNFVNRITIKTRSPSGFQSVNLGVYETAEYVLNYAKNKKKYKTIKQYIASSYDKNYNKIILNKTDSYFEWIIKPIREVVAKKLKCDTSNMAIRNIGKCEFEKKIEEFALKNADAVFRYTAISDSGASNETVELKKQSKKNDKILCQTREKYDDRYIHNGQEISFYSKKVRKIDSELVPSVQLTNIWSDISWEGIANEGGVQYKKGKKPLKLLKRIIRMTTGSNDIILDSFAGSGTTGDAVMELNKEDGGNRKFILIEMETDVIEKTTLKRLQHSFTSHNFSGGGGTTNKIYYIWFWLLCSW